MRSRRACLRNDPARPGCLCGRGLLRRCSSRRRCGHHRCTGRRRPRGHGLGRRHYRRTLHHGRGRLGRRLRLLALEDRLQRITRLRDLREVKLRLGLERWPGGRAPAAATQMAANLLGFIELDGARVGLLLRDANRRKSIQDLLALYFQLARQIVDSNFTHPFLFYFPCAPQLFISASST